ncbi:hypothetical protein ACP4OV_016617 [Aristida adscensionis]
MATTGSDLPPDAVRCVAELADAGSRARMRAVCSSWSAALPDEPPQPWVLVQPAADVKDDDDGAATAAERDCFSVLSLPANRELTLSRAFSSGGGFAGARCVGAGHGWLALVGADLNVTLHNPVTGRSVFLPPLVRHPMVRGRRVVDDGTIQRLWDIDDERAMVTCTAEEVRDTLVRKIVFSASPEQDDYFAVQLVHEHSPCAMFARAGATQWKTLRDADGRPVRLVNDVLHVEGSRFFAVTRPHGRVFQFDLAVDEGFDGEEYDEDGNKYIFSDDDVPEDEEWPSCVSEVAPPLAVFSYGFLSGMKTHVDNHLVLVNGEFFQIWAAWATEPAADEEDEDSSYRVIMDAGVVKCDPGEHMYLDVAGELDDWAVLIGANETVAVRAGDMPAVRGNCVYFIDCRLENVVCAYDLGAQCAEAVDCEMLRRAWPMGPARWSSPQPVWFMPSNAGAAAAAAEGPKGRPVEVEFGDEEVLTDEEFFAKLDAALDDDMDIGVPLCDDPPEPWWWLPSWSRLSCFCLVLFLVAFFVFWMSVRMSV